MILIDDMAGKGHMKKRMDRTRPGPFVLPDLFKRGYKMEQCDFRRKDRGQSRPDVLTKSEFDVIAVVDKVECPAQGDGQVRNKKCFVCPLIDVCDEGCFDHRCAWT